MNRFRLLAFAAMLALPLAACDEGTGAVDIVEGSITGTVTIEGDAASGVSVALSGGTGAPTTTTDGSGSYTFLALVAGSYTVTLTSGIPSDATFASLAKAAMITNAGQVATVNFDGTFIRTSSIVGAVVASTPSGAAAPGVDDDSGPARVPGGIAGVEVNLSGDNGSGNTTTDAGGQWSFTGLRAGTYTVSIAPDANLYNFPSTSTSVTVGSGGTEIVSAFENGTEAATADITVTVNLDGSPVPNWPVVLVGPASRTGSTGSSGTVTFNGLPRGSYRVEIGNPDPANFRCTNQSQQVTIADIGGTGSASFSCVTIDEASIEGRVYADLNKNGSFDAGTDMPLGIDVTLSGAASNTMTSDGSGNYAFGMLESGSYTVGINNPDPDKWIFDFLSSAVTLTAQQNATVNFRAIERRDGVISGDVWYDEQTDNDGDGNFEGDGILTFNDVPVVGGTVVISGPDGQRSTTTDGNGRYRFINLLLGDYTVDCATCNTTFNRVGPSDPVTLADGASKATINFISDDGAGTFSGNLFIDGNENDIRDIGVDGVFCPSDPNKALDPCDISGVVVTLEGPNVGQFHTEVTDADGDYVFTDLPPGLYNVSISAGDAKLAPFPATIGVPNPVPFNLVIGAPVTVNFGFDIQTFMVKVPVVFGPDGPAVFDVDEKPAENVLVHIYGDQPLGTSLGNAMSDATGIATISFTRAAELSVPGAADFIAFADISNQASFDADAAIHQDETIEFDIDKNSFMQMLHEDHNLIWQRVFMRSTYVEQDLTPVADATLAAIVVDGPVGPPIPNLRMRLGFNGTAADLTGRTETANVDFPNDDFRDGFGGVTAEPNEATGEVTFYVAIPTGAGSSLPQFFSAEGKSPSVQIIRQGNLTADPNFVGTMIDGSERNIYLGDMVISYPLPDVLARLYHETNDDAGFQFNLVDGDIDNFINVPGTNVVDLNWDDGTGPFTIACALDGTGHIDCMDAPAAATSWELETNNTNVNIRYIEDGGITHPVVRDDQLTAAPGQRAVSDITPVIDDLRYEVDLGDEPFAFKFEGNTMRFFVFNETGPGIDGNGLRDGTLEASVAGVDVDVDATKSLGTWPGEFPVIGQTKDAPPTEGGVFAITDMFEGEYDLDVIGASSPATITASQMRRVDYTAPPVIFSNFSVITQTVESFDIERVTIAADVQAREMEVQFQGGSAAGLTFNNNNDDFIIDPNELSGNRDMTMTANDPVRQVVGSTVCDTGGGETVGVVNSTAFSDMQTSDASTAVFSFDNLWEGCYTIAGPQTPVMTQPMTRGEYTIAETDVNGGTTQIAADPLVFNFAADATDTDFELIFSNGTITVTVLDNVTAAPLDNILVRFSSCNMLAAVPGAGVPPSIEGNFLTGGFCAAELVLTPINNRTNINGQIFFTSLKEGVYQVDPVENSYNAASLPVEDFEVRRIRANDSGFPDSEAHVINIIP